MITTLTKSIVNDYLACPRKVYYRYIKPISVEPSIGEKVGKAFHQVSHEFYKEVSELIGEGSIFQNPMNYSSIPNHFSAVIQRLTEGMKELPLDNLLKNFIEYESNRWNSICEEGYVKVKDYFFPVYSEYKLRSDKLRLGGIIDRIYKDLDSTLILLEIKSGNVPTSKIGQDSLQRELAIYCMLCEQNNIKITRWGSYFPKTNEVWTEDVNIRAINRATTAINKVRKGIDDNIFTRVVDKGYASSLCRYCSFSTVCLFKG